MEEVEDTELVHAVAPDASIRELPVDPADVSTPAKFAATWATAVRIAARNGEVISQSGIGQDFNLGEDSWTSAEVATMNSALQYAAARHVTVVVASGDEGAIGEGSSTPAREVILPTSDPLVLAVGGTSLTANPVTGAYISETAWNTPGLPPQPGASGGGFSHLFARPAYQDGVPGIGATRGVPDVAADSSGATGMALAFSHGGGQGYILVGAGGTSAGAPFWAGLIALADQEAGHPLGFVNPAIYRIARGPLYHQAFHDITTGNNTVVLTSTSPPVTITGYQAGPGWDPVTGWGSPDAQVFQGRCDPFLRVDVAVHHAPAQLLGRGIDQLDLVGPAHHPVRDALADLGPGHVLDLVGDALQVLDVDGGDDVDARGPDVHDVLPPLGVPARARHVRVGELVDQGDLGMPGDHRVDIHLLQAAPPVVDLPAGDDLQAVDHVLRQLPPVTLDEPDDDVGAPAHPPVALVEHRVGLADAGRRAQVDPEVTGGFDRVGHLPVRRRAGRGLVAHVFHDVRNDQLEVRS